MSQQPSEARESRALRIAVVAGESSGDQLGAALIDAIVERVPGSRFFGIAGPRMLAKGCEPLAHSEELAVMGVAEIVRHLPRLLALRRRTERQILEARPDLFIGIDAPEFNLGLAARLKRAGLPTVQYVSPQVWAWRQGRVRTIGRACDLVLCLLPFETVFYRRHGVEAVFVGHPLADQIPLEVDRVGARRALGIRPETRVVALLPGSRVGEVDRLGADFAGAAAWLHRNLSPAEFLAPMASTRVRAIFEAQVRAHAGPAAVRLLEGQAQLALAAADGAIVASGTATLETLLSKRPMVVAYRLAPATAFLLQRVGLVKVRYFAQPNLLAERALVPEFFQDAVNGERLGRELAALLGDAARVAMLEREFLRIHESLRCGGAARAAEAVLHLLGRRHA